MATKRRKSKSREEARREFGELLGPRDAPTEGRHTPINIIRKPIKLPPMERIKDG